MKDDLVGWWKKYFEDLEPRLQEEQYGSVLAIKQWAGFMRVIGSLPNQSTCVLWTWRRHAAMSLVGISRHSQGPEGIWSGDQQISSLLLEDDLVLLAPSCQDLQHVQHALRRIAAECASWIRISSSMTEAMVLEWKKLAFPL